MMQMTDFVTIERTSSGYLDMSAAVTDLNQALESIPILS